MSLRDWTNPRRWAGLLAVAILLAFCLLLLGSSTTAAQKASLPNEPRLDRAAASSASTVSSGRWLRPRSESPASRPARSEDWWQSAGAPSLAASAQPHTLTPLTPPLPDGVDLAVCQATDRAWGVVGAGETVTVTVDGAQMGATLADGNGFFWTTLYDALGDTSGLSGGLDVAIYHNGTQEANVELRPIAGTIDVVNDTVDGTIGGTGFPIDVTVYVYGAEPSLVSYSQTVSTNGSGEFSADFSGIFDLLPWAEAMVAYVEGGVEVHEHVYASPNLLIRASPWDQVMGTSFPGSVVTATVYDSSWSPKASATLEADPTTGWYDWDATSDLLPGDIVVADMAGGLTLSRTVETLSLSVDPASGQVTGEAEPGQVVRGLVGDLTADGWRDVTASTTADASTGSYTLDFSGLADIRAGAWAGVFAADAEGDDQNLWNNSPLVEVHQTWNQVTGRGPSPPGPNTEGRVVTLTLSSSPQSYNTTMDWWSWYDFNQDDHGLPDIGPGDIVTVEVDGYPWQGVVEVKEMTVGHDVDADQFTGTVQPPGDRVELTGNQWEAWANVGSLYPVGGTFDTLTTASSAFTASPAGFDVRNAVEYDVLHRTADDYLEIIHNQVDFLRVWPQYNGTDFALGPPGTAFTLTLRHGDGTFKAEVTGTFDQPPGWTDWRDFWPTGEQILPGDQLQAQSEAGFDQTVHIPDIMIQVDDVADLVSGSAPANSLLYVQVEGDQGEDRGWVPTNPGNGAFAVAVDQLQQVQDGDLELSDGIMVCYVNEDANQVCRNYEQPWTRVNYGHDWVGANYPAGHTFWMTVTDSLGVPKGFATMDSEPVGGWGGDGFETREENWLGGEPPDIVPGDWVHFRSDDDYSHSLQVGTVDGAINTDTDSVSGTIYVPWFEGVYDLLDIECHPWGAPDENTEVKESTAGPDGDPEYFCQWDPGEWDIQPGQEVAVMYVEPDDGDRVMNVFRDPAPDMHVEKWPEGSDQVAAGGHAVFTIRYRNEGDLPAQTVLLTDTLPAGTIYIDDSSGATPSFGTGTVTWNLGAVGADEEKEFQLVIELPPDPDPLLVNQADIWAEYDFNDWNDHAEAEVWVTGDVSYDPYVDKHAAPDRPAPGGTYIYEINYGNNGPVPTGPSTLTDILPAGTSAVDWYSENGYSLWNEVSRNGQLILETDTLPGNWGDRIVLRLAVDPDVEIDTQLTNTVELDIPVGFASYTHNDAWVGEPYWDSHVNKGFDWGSLVPGGEIGFNVHVRNDGNQPTQTWLTDTLPTDTSLAGSWRWDGQQYLEWPPDDVNGQTLAWDVGEMLPGQWVNLDLRLAIDSGVAPDTDLKNCAQIGIDGDDNWLDDNEDCVTVTVREPGTNMRVEKWHDWQDDDHVLSYEIKVENVGTNRLEDVLIRDTYPEFTTFNGDWWIDYGPQIEIDSHNPGTHELVFWAEKFDPGETARINFRVDLDDPGTPMRWYTNTIEVPAEGDVYPGDNVDEDVAFSGGEVQRVDIEVYRHSTWGCAYDTPITIETATEQRVIDWDTCWDLDDLGEPFLPGDVVTITAGAATQPVVIEIPDPYTAFVSGDLDEVWGQIDHLDHEPVEIDVYGLPWQTVETDSDGNYVATYDDIPHGAQGDVNYRTEIDYAEVTFHRRMDRLDLVLDVNYDHNWVNGEYLEAGHTVWFTLTQSDGITVKDTAITETAPIPWWDNQIGFEVYMDVEPGDWVYGEMDTGSTAALHVGTITGAPSTLDDSIRGTVAADWITQQVNVECHPWGAGHPAPNKQDKVFPNGSDPYYCSWDPDTEWDVQPEQDLAVSYDDPDGHRVYAVFQVRAQIYLPLVLNNYSP